VYRSVGDVLCAPCRMALVRPAPWPSRRHAPTRTDCVLGRSKSPTTSLPSPATMRPSADCPAATRRRSRSRHRDLRLRSSVHRRS